MSFGAAASPGLMSPKALYLFLPFPENIPQPPASPEKKTLRPGLLAVRSAFF
jgi:hypothetical protein